MLQQMPKGWLGEETLAYIPEITLFQENTLEIINEMSTYRKLGICVSYGHRERNRSIQQLWTLRKTWSERRDLIGKVSTVLLGLGKSGVIAFVCYRENPNKTVEIGRAHV